MTFESDIKEPSGNKGPQEDQSNPIGIWIPIGAGVGVAMGLVLDNLALGIGVGLAIGAAIGVAIQQKRE